jgi:apolipoprotein D and lipocalin family protein
MNFLTRILQILPAAALTACSATSPVRTVQHVDIDRFMGDWYVIANIPTFIEEQAYNPLENYRKINDREIATTFTFNKGSFDGPLKTYTPRGYISDDPSNAIWGMQFIWPIKADYRVVYLDENYTQTVIGRNKLDYVWIMARTPQISDADYQEILSFIAELGYDISKVKLAPQQKQDQSS